MHGYWIRVDLIRFSGTYYPVGLQLRWECIVRAQVYLLRGLCRLSEACYVVFIKKIIS
jgi:hypothetical protein